MKLQARAGVFSTIPPVAGAAEESLTPLLTVALYQPFLCFRFA